MSPSLERRYRRLLAWYPSGHRAEYEEEMVAERTRPRLREVVLLALALIGGWVGIAAVQRRERRAGEIKNALSSL